MLPCGSHLSLITVCGMLCLCVFQRIGQELYKCLLSSPLLSSRLVSSHLPSPHFTSRHFTTSSCTLHLTSHLTSLWLTLQLSSAELTSSHLTSPHLTSPHLTSPHLTSPHLTSPHLTSPHLTSPHLTSPHLTSPHLTSSHPIPSHPIACTECIMSSWNCASHEVRLREGALLQSLADRHAGQVRYGQIQAPSHHPLLCLAACQPRSRRRGGTPSRGPEVARHCEGMSLGG